MWLPKRAPPFNILKCRVEWMKRKEKEEKGKGKRGKGKEEKGGEEERRGREMVNTSKETNKERKYN